MSFTNSDVRDLYSKILNLKMQAFEANTLSYFPLDKYDHIATHMAVCLDNGDGVLNPILAFRAISTERCKQWNNISFIGQEIVNEIDSDIHKMALNSFLGTKENDNIAYLSSIVMDPLHSPEVLCESLKMFISMSSFYHKEWSISKSFTIGRKNCKSDLLIKKRFGLLPLALHGKSLPEVLIYCFITDEKYNILLYNGVDTKRIRQSLTKYETAWQEKVMFKEGSQLTPFL